jgi:site-specific DNA-methyltransferase (adenine-specific)
MYSHHITKEAYALVPVLDMKTTWSDEALYARYGINKADIACIESKIREME